MSKLDELLSISDKEQRLSAMAQYARSLGVNIFEAEDRSGKLIEEKLTLLIYDAQQIHKKARVQNRYFASIGLAFLAIMLVIVSFMPRILNYVYLDSEGSREQKQKVYQGFDEKGKPVTENQAQNTQPTLFKLMDGIYEEYYDNGTVKAESHYKNGALILKKEFDETGKLISVQEFNPESDQASQAVP